MLHEAPPPAVRRGDNSEWALEARRARARGAILVLYLLILVEDAGRKVFGLPDAILLAKDAWVVILYLIFLPTAVRHTRIKTHAVALLVAGFGLWLLLEGTTPGSSFLTLMLGFKTYLFYIPLALVAEYAFFNYRPERLYRVLIVTGAVIATGAVVSALAGDSGPPLLRPLSADAGVHTYEFGELYLAPSFFATAEKAADQLLVSGIAAICMYMSAGTFKARAFALCGTFFITAGLVGAARRLPLLLFIALVGVTAVRPMMDRLRLRRRTVGAAAPRRGFALLFVVGLAFAVTVVTVGIQGYLGFVADARSAGAVISQSTSSPGAGLSVEGRGTGTLSQGVDRLDLPRAIVEGPSEGMAAKVWQEIGVPGFVMYLALLAASCQRSGLCSRPLGDLDNWGPKMVVVSVLLMGIKAHQTFDNPQVHIVFWSALGTLATLSRVSSARAASG